MAELGFKKLTVENWLEPDKVSIMFVRLLPDGEIRAVDGNDRLRHILEPSLTETVPDEIRRLFEVARGALAYGYLFYPLYTLAGDQLLRVAEAAVTEKCAALGAPSSVKTFKDKLDYLINQQVISKDMEIIWDAIRELRNITSHPNMQNISPPDRVLKILHDVANKINSLFP